MITRSMAKKRFREDIPTEIPHKQTKTDYSPASTIPPELIHKAFSFLSSDDQANFHEALIPFFKAGKPLDPQRANNPRVSFFKNNKYQITEEIFKEIKHILIIAQNQKTQLQEQILQLKQTIHTILWSRDPQERRIQNVRKELILFLIQNNIKLSLADISSPYILQSEERNVLGIMLSSQNPQEKQQALLELSSSYYQAEKFDKHLLALQILNRDTKATDRLCSLGEMQKLKKLTQEREVNELTEEEIDLIRAFIENRPLALEELPDWLHVRYRPIINYHQSQNAETYVHTTEAMQLYILKILLARNEIKHIRHLIPITPTETKESLTDLLLKTHRLDLAEEVLDTIPETSLINKYLRCQLLIKRRDFASVPPLANTITGNLAGLLMRRSLQVILTTQGADFEANSINLDQAL